ncbi:RecQ family ATP-dependent DNA helicase [Patescibacteria group bacterium]|nr:RecQ family ATP-dependent DNA helicase [Patescibacteria group bacterium]
MQQLLKTYFGYSDFRPLQREVIEHVMSGKDTLVLMPTGGGKSLCFQLPALALPGLTLVISPLIALMKDQVDALVANGVSAAFVNSSLPASQAERIWQDALTGKIKLLYIAPERVPLLQARADLLKLPVSLIAIDEAHCISEWGHDFRPEYRQLNLLRELYQQAPLIALTATANPRVKQDILNQLRFRQGKIFQSSFNRPNLLYRVVPKKQSFEHLLHELRARPGQAVVVYCFSRKSTEQIAERLVANGVSAAAYHAGLPAPERARVQERFIRDEIPVIVATIAFGMGIDKPDVRLVVHMDLPKSVEGYYQETGRAGRDGLPSQCLLFYSAGDRVKQEMFIRDLPTLQERQRAYDQLRQMVQFCEVTTCRRTFLLNYFGETRNEVTCDACDRCRPQETTVVLSAPQAETVAYDQGLFEALRAHRLKLAQEKGVPPYVIFGDRTLADLASRWPRNQGELPQIFGIGRTKMEQYGESFLAVIKLYAAEHGWPATQAASQPPVLPLVKARPKQSLGDSSKFTVELFCSGKSLQAVAQERQLTLGTILQHLEEAIQQGEAVSLSHVPFAEDRLETIKQAFKRAQGYALTPVRQALGESYSYDELRLGRLILRSRGSRGGI